MRVQGLPYDDVALDLETAGIPEKVLDLDVVHVEGLAAERADTLVLHVLGRKQFYARGRPDCECEIRLERRDDFTAMREASLRV